MKVGDIWTLCLLCGGLSHHDQLLCSCNPADPSDTALHLKYVNREEHVARFEIVPTSSTIFEVAPWLSTSQLRRELKRRKRIESGSPQ